jgi:hypothetical protein
MRNAVVTALAVGLVVATYETVRYKSAGGVNATWGAAAKSGLLGGPALGAAAAAAVAALLLR